MSLLVYHFLLLLYRAAIGLAALFQGKAALWVRGRRGLLSKIERAMASAGPGKRVWMHCASLGEFEQGRPVLEALRRQYPGCRIILTFFSPSGYELRKDFEGADAVFYLPLDSRKHADRFIRAVQPSLALFIKYEFWYHYLHTLHQQGIPVLLVSASFRPSQPFFQWYGGLFRKLLGYFHTILVQDAASGILLSGIGLGSKVILGGDTRYDRVAAIAGQGRVLPEIEAFKGSGHLLIAGSTWPEDERMLRAVLADFPEDWKLVLAPHEIGPGHISQIRAAFGDAAVLFSEWKESKVGARVLIIDNIGMLSALFRYGTLAFIGGGFRKGGIHNILEPAVFGLPVLFGPVYEKFVEARELVALGFAFPVADVTACKKALLPLMQEDQRRDMLKNSLKQEIRERQGATDRVLKLIAEHCWLDHGPDGV